MSVSLSGPPGAARWIFVDRDTYTALGANSRHFTVTDWLHLHGDTKKLCSSMSVHTLAFVLQLNDAVTHCLHGLTPIRQLDITPELPDTRSEAQEFLTRPIETVLSYEILPIDGQSFLVVIGGGFLHHMTHSKDSVQRFILHCLGHLDRFKRSDAALDQLYLKLLFVPQYETLLRLRGDCI